MNIQDCFQLPGNINRIEETSQIDEITKAKYTHITIYYKDLSLLKNMGSLPISNSQRSFFLYHK